MDLRYITCSGPDESTSIDSLIKLAKQSKLIEIGVIANSYIKKGKPQYDWFETLLHSQDISDINMALHLTHDWCIDFCNNKISPEIQQWLNMRDKTGKPIIRRWQLNIDNNMNLQQTDAIRNIIKSHPDKEFIFSLNNGPIVMSYIKKLYRTDVPFSLLYDSSYGTGSRPDKWEEPHFAGHCHGYAGGLCGENVFENLDKISTVVPYIYKTWIDAEFNLKKPGTIQFDVNRANDYITKSLLWLHQHKR